INLLREGLDIPEVSLVTILDADKEGFLRSTGSLIQTFGRAARNAGGKVLLYADTVTASMRAAMGETARRRAKQQDWNETHGITPTTISKPLATPFDSLYTSSGEGKGKRGRGKQAKQPAEASASVDITAQNVARYLKQFEREMRDAARDLEFEKAAALRDRIKQLREQFLIA
ncbi:UvrB/UvrC motif-containing protein, partial [Bilophila wadsworthia]